MQKSTYPLPFSTEEIEFLKESNAIEKVYDASSLMQALYAWEYLKEQKEITTGVVLKTHKILMLNQNLQPHEKGYFRTIQVWVGGREGAKSSDIPIAVEEWCEEMNDMEADGYENRSQALHVQYEKIHPFIDGNGRTGRMFMNWWRIKNGLSVLVIHEGDEQMKYYRWFH